MSYRDINIKDLQFNKFTDHNPGKSIATDSAITFITPWMKITSYPRTYYALEDPHKNNIERVNVFTEITDRGFIDWIFALEERARKELREQKVDPEPEKHWNHLLAHKKYLRTKLHVRPSKMLQLDAYMEGSEDKFDIELSKVSNYFYTGVVVRYVIEIRPILHKKNRSGITLRVMDVQFKKNEKSKFSQ